MLSETAHDRVSNEPGRDDLGEIRAYVRSLIVREWLVLALRGGLRVAASLAVVGLAASALPTLSLGRSVSTFALVTGSGLLAWWVVVPLLAEARSSLSDPLRPARFVEARVPELRGALVTAVDTAKRARAPGEAAPLARAVARMALQRVAPWPAVRVHPLAPWVPVGAAIAVSWAIVGVVLLSSPLGISGTLRWWYRALAADTVLAELVPEALRPEARVGDLVLRYTYPSYTGLEPKEILNSTGDVAAPPGTTVEVVARSAQAIEAAGLLVYDEPLEAEVGEEGRVLSGRFEVRSEAGEWKVVTWWGGQSLSSRAFAIVPEPDLAPDVTLDLVGDQVEVGVDERIAISWRARDDFGVRTAGLEIDGQEAGRQLFRATGRRAEVADVVGVRPVDLGLRPGDRVRLVVAAWDNDTVSGSKAGRSRTVELIVQGAAGRAEADARRQQELLALMLPILAHFLVEEFPPGHTAGRLAGWGEGVAGRYRPLNEAVERMWAESRVSAVERMVVGEVLDKGTVVIRYTQVGFEPGSSSIVPAGGLATVSELRNDAIIALEDAIAFLDRLARNVALEAVVAASTALGEAAVRLDAAIESGDPVAVASALDAEQAAIERLSASAQELMEGPLKEAVEQRTGEIREVQAELRKRLAAGGAADVAKLGGRLADMMRDLSTAVLGEIARQQQGADKTLEEAGDLLAELTELEANQRTLQKQVEGLRSEQDAATAESVAKRWAELEQRSAELGAHAAAVVDGLEAADRPFFEQERGRAAEEEGEELSIAIAARDVRGANQQVDRVQSLWQTLSITAARERRGPGPGPAEMDAGIRQAAEIARLLTQLEGAAAMDPSSAELIAAEQRQQALSSRLSDAGERARELGQKLPVQPRGLDAELDEAGERMGEASRQLGEGRAMQAEGEQSVAADRVAAARRKLEQAMERSKAQSARIGDGGGGASGDDEDGEQGEGGQGETRENQVEIPGREEFRTPEEYRRALLEGMEGDVPEEYRALKKRYYEELVAQ